MRTSLASFASRIPLPNTTRFQCLHTPRPYTQYFPFLRVRRTYASYGPLDQPTNFSGIAPPSPSSLGKPQAAKQYKRLRKYSKRLAYVAAFGGTVYLIDRFYNYSTLTRSIRTFYTGLYLTIDYSINFKPGKGEKIREVHERAANRIFDVLETNGGLYLKVGQAVAMQSAVLPPAFQKKFMKLFDEAPQASWPEIEKVFKEEYGGKSPDEVFMPGTFEKKAVASASIAQVHRARLKTGEEVAVKIQKPQVTKWVTWDLGSWKILMRMLSWYWDLPFYFIVPFVIERLESETDFTNEAQNATMMQEFVSRDASLRDRVYVPKTYPELNTKRIMVAEWINGVKLWDRETIEGAWKGSDMVGKEIKTGRQQTPRNVPRNEDTAFFDPPPPANTTTTTTNRQQEKKNPRAGLGLSMKDVMTTMVELFSSQMFLFGHVHCDPHPGNIFIRRTPRGKAELVLIDHGLYVHLNPEFRKLYCEFWTSLLTFDNTRLKQIAETWGIGNVDLFASATLLRPYEGGDNTFKDSIGADLDEHGQVDHYAMEMRLKQALKAFLKDTPKMPRELVFLGRNMRIVQGNNQYLGSPVNRIKLTALGASRGLLHTNPNDAFFGVTEQGRNVTWRDTFRSYWKYFVFRAVMVTFDMAFFVTKVRQKVFGGEGFEDVLEGKMRQVAKSGFGLELHSNVFEG